MKIAFIGQKGIPASYGGVERHVEELVIRLAKKAENEVYVYCRKWYCPENLKLKTNDQKIKTVFTPSIKTKQLDTISHVFSATLHALTQKYDIIHYQGIGPALLSFIPRLFCPHTRVLVTYHCADYEHQKWGLFAKIMLKFGEMASLYFPHETIVVSQNLKTTLENKYHKNVTHIPNGVNIPHEKTSSKCLEKWNLEKNHYLLTVNRLVRHKGIHFLIEAYQNLYPQADKKDLKLVIVGDSAFTDDYVEKLQNLAADNSNIIFTGYQQGKTLQALYENAYLFIHPSESEGLPIAILEALSYGKAVLASDIEANQELIKKYGVSFENGSVADLEIKLANLIANPQLVKSLSFSAQKAVLKTYNWDKITDRTYLVYQSLLKPTIQTGFIPSFRIISVKTI